MPELPEVESLRRSLMPYIVGQSIKRVEVRKPKLVSSSGTVRVENPQKVKEFQTELIDETIQNIERVAKNLVIKMKSGKCILVHLKMTGQLVYQGLNSEPKNSIEQQNQEESQTIATQNPHVTLNETGVMVYGGHPIELTNMELPNKHSHVIFELDRGSLYFNDTRMFGYLLYFPSYEALLATEHFEELGRDPLDENFTLEYFQKQLKTKKGILKAVFLNQEIVVGLGNIYADEVCFAAGVRPIRTCDTLLTKEVKLLYEAIKTILPLAVDMGGSSVANYLLGDGTKGNYAKLHMVYKRGGKPCMICGHTLISTICAGRTTVYCKYDQK